MLDYIRKKQLRLIANVPTNYIREKYFKKLTSKNRLVGLVGERGVGKTTLLLQYLKLNFKPFEYLYFSADDIFMIDKSIYLVVEEFIKYGGKVVVIDEIHKYNNWAQELKNIYDSFPDIIIRFSGSSMLNILNEKYDLSRRVVIYEVETLNFKEFMRLYKNIDLSNLSLDTILNEHINISSKYILKYPNLYSDFKKYLEIGYYPFFLEDEREYKNKLFNACDKIINEDIPSLNRIDYIHISIFKRILAKLIYSKVPYKVNISALSKELEISHPTLMTYLDILEKTKLVKSVIKYSKNISKKPAKLYFGNPNLLYIFSNEFGVDVDIGLIRETFFINIFREIFYSDIGDFRVGDYIFEIGGKAKSFKQIKDIKGSYLVVDTDYEVNKNRIPLWIFGLLE